MRSGRCNTLRIFRRRRSVLTSCAAPGIAAKAAQKGRFCRLRVGADHQRGVSAVYRCGPCSRHCCLLRRVAFKRIRAALDIFPQSRFDRIWLRCVRQQQHGDFSDVPSVRVEDHAVRDLLRRQLIVIGQPCFKLLIRRMDACQSCHFPIALPNCLCDLGKG